MQIVLQGNFSLPPPCSFRAEASKKVFLSFLEEFFGGSQKAEKLSRSESFGEIKEFVQKIGTNHQLLDKSASFSFVAPWDSAALRLAQSGHAK